MVVIGVACLVAAGYVLLNGDEGPWSECSTSTTKKLHAEQAAPASSSPSAPPASSASEPALVVTEQVTECKPTSLTGGFALLLGFAGVALLLPAWVRAMPDAELETPFAKLRKGPPVSKDETRERAHDAFSQARALESVNGAMQVAEAGLPVPASVDAAPDEPASDDPRASRWRWVKARLGRHS